MTKISAFAVLLLATVAAQELLTVQARVQCPEVVRDLMPCLGYLQGDEEGPSTTCCGGVVTLYAAAARTRENRQETCECLKAAYLEYDVIVSAAQALPRECGVGLSYPITPDVDCSTIP